MHKKISKLAMKLTVATYSGRAVKCRQMRKLGDHLPCDMIQQPNLTQKHAHAVCLQDLQY